MRNQKMNQRLVGDFDGYGLLRRVKIKNKRKESVKLRTLIGNRDAPDNGC